MTDNAADFLTELLTGTAAQIDVPADLLALADAIYADLGGYLSENLPGERNWLFYPQGSARIGTSVYPTGPDEWDVDTVAEVDLDKAATTQAALKQMVGTALRDYMQARAGDPQLGPTGGDAGRRCWTLTYRHPFHVDVLPAVPNRDRDAPPTGIWLADRDLVRWQPSNPKGYAEWFTRQMGREFIERQTELAKAASVSIDDIPTWRVKTTLQRSVQILKLHRNAFFANDLDNRPPSCVVTTLAGLSYDGERSLFAAVMTAAAPMSKHITQDGAVWVVENPAQPGDNLADRWSQNLVALRRFQPWLDDLQSTLESATTRTGVESIVASLASRFDETLLTKAAREVASRAAAAVAPAAIVTEGLSRSGGRFGPVPDTRARTGRAG